METQEGDAKKTKNTNPASGRSKQSLNVKFVLGSERSARPCLCQMSCPAPEFNRGVLSPHGSTVQDSDGKYVRRGLLHCGAVPLARFALFLAILSLAALGKDICCLLNTLKVRCFKFQVFQVFEKESLP